MSTIKKFFFKGVTNVYVYPLMLLLEVGRASMLLLDSADTSGWALPGISMSQATDQTLPTQPHNCLKKNGNL